MNYRGLLGLSLAFIQKPKFTNHKMSEWTDRFRSDIFTRVFMAHQQTPVPRLFIRSNWTPPIHLINFGVRMRVERFIKNINRVFTKKSTKSNMLPFQRNLLAELRQNKKFVVFSADKNLGPCIIERQQYIKRALSDHLLDRTTYTRLTNNDARNKMEYIETRLLALIEKFGKHLATTDMKYLKRTVDVKDPYAKFYLTAKIHKTPWTTRPIVSISGSKLAGLGCWIDKILQPYARSIPSFIKSSYELKNLLITMPPLPSTARLLTADAVSMYTNIEINDALRVLKYIINNSPHFATSYEQYAVIEALNLLMKNNLFQFGDTYWLQIDGTAMGVSPSCTYATLYFSEHEKLLLKHYPEIIFYRRYIDDLFGIWVPTSNNDNVRWKSFQHDLDKCGKLRWNVTERDKSVNFLDLTITIDSDYRINTKLYEKIQNLYLYLPRNSSHSPGNLKGLVAGMIFRTMMLTSCSKTQKIEIQRLFKRLVARGHPPQLLKLLIENAYIKYANPQPKVQSDCNDVCFFHTYYHPNDPPSHVIQRIFRQQMLHILNKPKFWELRNHKSCPIGIRRLIIAYHRTPNLGNMLSARLLKPEDCPLVSSFL